MRPVDLEGRAIIKLTAGKMQNSSFTEQLQVPENLAQNYTSRQTDSEDASGTDDELGLELDEHVIRHGATTNDAKIGYGDEEEEDGVEGWEEDDEEDEEDGEEEEEEGTIDARPGYDPDAELSQKRAQLQYKLKTKWEELFTKYERDFDGIGDEIDLMTGEIYVNNGHLLEMEDEDDEGDIYRAHRSLEETTEGLENDLGYDTDGTDPLLKEDIIDSVDEEQNELSDEEMMEDDLILRGFAKASQNIQPEGGVSPTLGNLLEGPDDTEELVLSSVEPRDMPSPSAILAQFGPEIGPQIVQFVTTGQMVDDGLVEPAWRAPPLPRSLSVIKPIPKAQIPQILSDRSPSPQTNRSLWTETPGRREKSVYKKRDFERAKSIAYHVSNTQNVLPKHPSLGNPAPLPQSSGKTRPRLSFNSEDQARIFDLLANARREGSQLSGTSWKQLANKYPHHSAGSWKSQYERNRAFYDAKSDKSRSPISDSSLAPRQTIRRQPAFATDGGAPTSKRPSSQHRFKPTRASPESDTSVLIALGSSAAKKPSPRIPYAQPVRYSSLTTPSTVRETFDLTARKTIRKKSRDLNQGFESSKAFDPASKPITIDLSSSSEGETFSGVQKVPRTLSRRRSLPNTEPTASAAPQSPRVVTHIKPSSNSQLFSVESDHYQKSHRTDTSLGQTTVTPITGISSLNTKPSPQNSITPDSVTNPSNPGRSLRSNFSKPSQSARQNTIVTYINEPMPAIASGQAVSAESPKVSSPSQISSLQGNVEKSLQLETVQKQELSPRNSLSRASSDPPILPPDQSQQHKVANPGHAEDIKLSCSPEPPKASNALLRNLSSPNLADSRISFGIAPIISPTTAVNKPPQPPNLQPPNLPLESYGRNMIDTSYEFSDEESFVEATSHRPADEKSLLVLRETLPPSLPPAVVREGVPSETQGLSAPKLDPQIAEANESPSFTHVGVTMSDISQTTTDALLKSAASHDALPTSVAVTVRPQSSHRRRSSRIENIPQTKLKKLPGMVAQIKPKKSSQFTKVESPKPIRSLLTDEEFDELGLEANEFILIPAKPDHKKLATKPLTSAEATMTSPPSSTIESKKRNFDEFQQDASDDELAMDGAPTYLGSIAIRTPVTVIKKEKPTSNPVGRPRKKQKVEEAEEHDIKPAKSPNPPSHSKPNFTPKRNSTVFSKSRIETPLLNLTPSRRKIILDEDVKPPVSVAKTPLSQALLVIEDSDASPEDDDENPILLEVSTPTKVGRSQRLTPMLRANKVAVTVRTPGGSLRKCGEDGFRCQKYFCFRCQREVGVVD